MKSSQFKQTVHTLAGGVTVYSLPELEKSGFAGISKLPYSIRVILESALRNLDGFSITEDDVKKIAGWKPGKLSSADIAFKPARVILQDFTGVPTIVDLAAMRAAMKRLGGDFKKINPLVPCDLVVDHSIQVDAFGTPDALRENVAKEFERNIERYEFLKWGQQAFQNFRVVPPMTGIVHQVNLEYLAHGVMTKKNAEGETVAYPDSVMGTDSHTTMVNGLGVLGWGVGGIEAEAVMLGEPIFMLLPEVVGFKFKGALKKGVTATDLVLTVTQILRAKGVVGKFVEFYGEGLAKMSLPDRATIANMAPEYGATMGFFPVDAETLAYYRVTGRPAAQVDLIEKTMKAQGMFYTPGQNDPVYSETLELDLSTVEPSLAGPKRPQDRVSLSKMKSSFLSALEAPVDKRGFGLTKEAIGTKNGAPFGHGAVTIAAITSCTNTSNPSVMIGAGLVAKKAVEKGLARQPHVKTSLAPGSRVVSDYLDNAGLTPFLEKLGFHTVGYGCTTCIGNSGPLPDDVAKIVKDKNLVVASVLSGNRNFEGRVNPLVKANYLASPPLVVAYAIAGRVDVDLETEPIGTGKDGKPVYLKDIWPTEEEIKSAIEKSISASVFEKRYKGVFEGSAEWKKVQAAPSDLFDWKLDSTYIQEPPFFEGMDLKPAAVKPLKAARVLGVFGDSITTDHISPAGDISAESPAGKFLQDHGVAKADFNSYGARRGNDRVMVRGTFANVRLRNVLAGGKEGWWTTHQPSGKLMPIYDASIAYAAESVPLVILAGKEYGTGSSRDWAAKGTALLGVRAVIAQSFERIHRSNLVGMGVLPLEFKDGESRETLGLTGTEVYDFEGLEGAPKPFQKVFVTATAPDGKKTRFETTARIDTPVEVEYYKNGGILPTVLRKLAKS